MDHNGHMGMMSSPPPSSSNAPPSHRPPPSPSPPDPPASPPSPPFAAPNALLIADGVTWTALLAGAAVLLAAAWLMVQDGRIGLSRLGSRRLLLGRLLRAFAVLCLAIACLPYYAEARFSVATTSYATAGVNNPFIRLWNDAEGEWRSALHFGLWVVVSFAFAFAGIALSAAELLDREQPAAAADSPARFRRLRWHLNHSKGSLALVFVLLYSVAIAVGHSTDRLGGRFHWGAAPYWNAEKHGRFIGMCLCSAFYAGYGGLLPMTLIGIPLSRTSALWRAMGRSYEEAIAFHRARPRDDGAVCVSRRRLHGLLADPWH